MKIIKLIFCPNSPTCMRVMQHMGQLYEEMTVSPTEDETCSAPSHLDLNYEVTKRVIARSVFLWLSLLVEKSDAPVQEEKGVHCDELIAFLTLEGERQKSGGFLASFCDALRHVRHKETMVKGSTPFALKVIKVFRL